jgi:hypothetical protein
MHLLVFHPTIYLSGRFPARIPDQIPAKKIQVFISFTQVLQAITLNTSREVRFQSLVGVITPQTISTYLKSAVQHQQKYISQFNADFHFTPLKNNLIIYHQHKLL